MVFAHTLALTTDILVASVQFSQVIENLQIFSSEHECEVYM